MDDGFFSSRTSLLFVLGGMVLIGLVVTITLPTILQVVFSDQNAQKSHSDDRNVVEVIVENDVNEVKLIDLVITKQDKILINKSYELEPEEYISEDEIVVPQSGDHQMYNVSVSQPDGTVRSWHHYPDKGRYCSASDIHIIVHSEKIEYNHSF